MAERREFGQANSDRLRIRLAKSGTGIWGRWDTDLRKWEEGTLGRARM